MSVRDRLLESSLEIAFTEIKRWKSLADMATQERDAARGERWELLQQKSAAENVYHHERRDRAKHVSALRAILKNGDRAAQRLAASALKGTGEHIATIEGHSSDACVPCGTVHCKLL